MPERLELKLSVVLITRNQAWNVERLIGSVLDEVVRLDGEFEVFLVDSASTDGTAETASELPVSVLVLLADQPLTAAAARHVGYLNTTGDYTMFLDGDMELIPGWLEMAIRVLDDFQEVASVTGRRVDLLPGGSSEAAMSRLIEGDPSEEPELADVRHGGGAAVYRRSSLEEVGSFNPYLYSDEEPELCIRLRFAGGYRIVRLDMPHVLHYTEPITEFSTLIDRARRNLYVGSGQIIRHLWGSPMLMPYLRERGFAFVPAAVMFVGVGFGIYAAISGDARLLVVWAAMVVGVVAADAIRKRGLHPAFLSLLARSLHITGTIRGLRMPAAEPADYPGRFRVVR